MEDVGEETGHAVIVGGGACVQAMYCSVRRVKGSAFAIQGSCHVALEECELYLSHTEAVFAPLSKKNAAQVLSLGDALPITSFCSWSCPGIAKGAFHSQSCASGWRCDEAEQHMIRLA
jgi:hypothetical protein